MSKSKEIKQYLSKVNTHTKSSINKLIEDGRIIYGDFINKDIFKKSNTKMPKAGILIIEEKELIFYGAKSLFEKEVLVNFPYEDLKLTSHPTFTMNFIFEQPNFRLDKCKFSFAWEDYISKNIKPLFISAIKEKISKSLKKRASKLLKQKNIDNTDIYFYFNKLITSKIYDKKLIQGYLSLIRREILNECNNSSNKKIFKDVLEKKEKLLFDFFPDQKALISKDLSKFSYEILENDSYLTDTDEAGKNIERRKIYRNKIDLIKEIKEEEIIQILSYPKVKNSIEKKINSRIKQIKEDLLETYNEKLQTYANQFETEKKVYKEIIKENILLPKDINLSEKNTDTIIAQISQFYSRYKNLDKILTESFSIDRLKPNDGVKHFLQIIERYSIKYLKIVDPYFFSDELTYLENIPQHVNIQVLTSAIMDSEFKSNLPDFKNKLEKIRKKRIGRFQIKVIKYKNKNGTPLHDRAIFSDDWALSLSNSLSQIGAKYDITFTRIYDCKDREEIGFNNFWFMHNEVGKKGKVKQLFITDL